jgi:hypothetical protein
VREAHVHGCELDAPILKARECNETTARAGVEIDQFVGAQQVQAAAEIAMQP